MSLTSLPNIQEYLYPFFPSSWAGSDATRTIDAADEFVGSVFYAPFTATIRKIHVKMTSDLVGTLTVGLYTVNSTTGYATNTAYGGMSPATLTDPTTGLVECTLATDGSLIQGDLLCIKIKCTARTSGAANIVYNSCAGGNTLVPCYHNEINANASYIVAAIMEDSSGVLYRIPAQFMNNGYTDVAFSSSTEPDEIGNKITIPFDMRVNGLFSNWTSASVAPDGVGTFYLRDSGGSTLASGTPKFTILSAGRAFWYFASPVELLKDANVYASYAPGASSRTIKKVAFHTAAIKELMLGKGTLITRTDAGAWSETATELAPIGLIYDQISLGGGGGMITHPGMTGGIRG